MLNAIPVIGWFISALCAMSLAVPFWLIWTVFGIGNTFFYWLPPVYLQPGFWECVGVFIVVSIIKLVFVPRFASSYSSSEAKK
jgi:hypothetical protein